MSVNVDGINDDNDTAVDLDSMQITPIPASESIDTLRAKLHNKISALSNRTHHNQREQQLGEPSSRDELLDDRRRERAAAMRERRRKETKEKIRLEREGRKGGKQKAEQTKGSTTKV